MLVKLNRFICGDQVALLDAQDAVDGSKVRGINEIVFEEKALPKLYNFLIRLLGPDLRGVEITDEAREKLASVSANVKRRKEVVVKARNNYGKEIIDYKLRGKYKPLMHQVVMYNIMTNTDASAILADPGTCKTGPYLWAIDKYIQNGDIRKCLIITLSHLKDNVIEEMKAQVPHLKGVVLKNSVQANKILNKKYKIAKMNTDYDIYMANYESMFSLVDMIEDGMFQMVILDEAHRLGAPRSRQTKSIIKKFKNVPYKYIISGTLHANNLMSFFMPFRFLGPDTIPEANYYAFRKRFFKTVDDDGYIWVPNRGAHAIVRKIIGALSVSFKKEDCLDLPEKIYQTYSCEMSPEQKKVYDKAKEDMIIYIENMCNMCDMQDRCDGICEDNMLVKNALVLTTKLAQIACGFYRNTSIEVDDDGKKIDNSNIISFDSSKIKLLVKTIDGIPANKKIIVWSTFIHALGDIEAELKKHFGGIVTIRSNSNAFAKVEEFKKSGKRILIANPRKAGTGLNIQFSNYQIFFNNNYSFVQRDQAESRQYRKGQENSVTIIDLICKDTVDETILGILKNKEEMSISLSTLARVAGMENVHGRGRKISKQSTI